MGKSSIYDMQDSSTTQRILELVSFQSLNGVIDYASSVITCNNEELNPPLFLKKHACYQSHS